MDAAGGEGVLQHLQHGGVPFPGLRGVIGAVVAEVEVVFDLAQVLVVREAPAEDGFAVVPGVRFGGECGKGGDGLGEGGGGEVVREWEVGYGGRECGPEA